MAIVVKPSGRIGSATLLLLSLAFAARGQDDLVAGPFDACGTLVQGNSCVLFEGGGGRFFLSDYGNYRAGDLVRVVGTLDPDCVTICAEGDGCISGAEVYNPAVFPCGTPIEAQFDPCSGAAASLLGLALAGLCFPPRARARSRGAREHDADAAFTPKTIQT